VKLIGSFASPMHPDVLADLTLARQLERAEALANARFVEARARIVPDSGAQWIEVAGAYAMYDGIRSPCTQTFGLGLFEKPAPTEMEKLEAFFKERGAPVFHEVSPIADKSLLVMLNERGYRPIEFTSVMFLPLDRRVEGATVRNAAIHVRVVSEEERDLWARVTAEGWREFTEIADLMVDLMRVSAATEGVASFLAELDGRPIAAGGLAIQNGVALLAGASTIPEWRHLGAQRALLESRLEFASHAGCALAMICAEPGSASQRNAERQGFRIAYTRTKWYLTGS
jgi:GNAT superfamily N-acetyltransferase